MLEGLKEVEKGLQQQRISFCLLLGQAPELVPSLVTQHQVSAVVCDFSPLRLPSLWVDGVTGSLDKLAVPLVQVDAHNVVPCWVTSDKQEYAARTIRGKITRQLSTYLVEFPVVTEHPHPLPGDLLPVDWEKVYSTLQVDTSVPPVSWATPGTKAGMRVLEEFCRKRLALYDPKRNDPNEDALSNLSPWLHFGQVSAQRAALSVRQAKTARNKASVEAFLEEAIVRRELGDNFCLYNKNYDSIQGAPQWARGTLRHHEGDEGEDLLRDRV